LASFLQYRIRNDPDPGALVRGYLTRSVTRTRLQLLPNLIESYEYNRDVLRRVGAPLSWAVVSLIIGLVIFFVIALNSWGAQWLRKPADAPVNPAVSPEKLSSEVPTMGDSFRVPTAPSSATVKVSSRPRQIGIAPPARMGTTRGSDLSHERQGRRPAPARDTARVTKP
jgi:hypothetical protein